MSANVLDREISPYLLQHKDNPVHWQPWGGAALALAKRENKPILLSVGYAACHWCHVMAHESFEDPETAALMNAHFISVKVDREERPDIDAIYQSALALLGQHGGWPLTMFLTPDGEPFWGGTYFPSENRFGRPSFRDVLRRLHEVYTSDPEAVAKNRSALREALDKLAEPSPDAPAVSLSLELLDAVAGQLAGEIDPRHGGLGGAPKFPHVPAFELLWRAYLRGGPAACRDAVTLTLDRMCQGGIYDHLGGGFARYATDPAWLVPHFEKMLYDNAQLLDLLTLVWQHEKSPLYAQRARETAEWVLREMVAEGGGFAATQDADSEGVEGKFYVWSEAEIDTLLGAAAEPFKAAYDVTPGGNWEGHTILNRSARPALLSEAQEADLARSRQVLWRHREGRIKPGWDDKVLADWNGQMIAALATASAAFDEPRWLEAARAAFAFVCEHMSVDGRLRHSSRQGRALHAALLDDYANMARAALTLFEVTGVDDYLSRAEAWVEVVEAHYRDPRHGGYFYTADDAEGLITRTRSAADNAVPAGNGTLAAVLARLYHLSGEERYRERAAAIITAFAAEVGRNFIPLATLLNAYELLDQALQIVIVGARGEAATEALLAMVHGAALPNRVLLVAGDGDALPAHHPAHGKGRVEGKPAAYLCIGTACSLPLSEPEALAATLARPSAGA